MQNWIDARKAENNFLAEKNKFFEVQNRVHYKFVFVVAKN